MKITGADTSSPAQAGSPRKVPAGDHGSHVRQAGEGKPGIQHTGKAPVPASLPAAAAAANLAASLGLPRDRLSASILSFFRFFSLPLEPALLAKIRALPGSAPETAAPVKPGQFRAGEALSLAAAAALDKGAELSGDALEHYARALDPARQNPDEPEEQTRDRAPKDGSGSSSGGGYAGNEGRNSAENFAGNSDGRKRQRDSGKPDTSSGDLKERALRGAASPLLTLMNRLPGRDGKRWIALPFNWGPEDRYKAVLRILMSGARPLEAERMALEIAGDKGHWLFTLDAQGGSGRIKLNFSRQPFPGKKTMDHAVRELSGLLNLPPERIYAQNGDEFPFFAPDSRAEALITINEEV
jgi:hypothetical protein